MPYYVLMKSTVLILVQCSYQYLFLLENQDCQLALDIQVSQDSQDHLQALDLHLHLEALGSLEAQGLQGCYHPVIRKIEDIIYMLAFTT